MLRDRAPAWRQIARGLLARRWSSLALLVTGALTVAAATLGPLYARAAQESVLQDGLAAAGVDGTGLHVAVPGDVAQSDTTDRARRLAAPADVPGVYPDRIEGVRVTTRVAAPGSAEPAQRTRLVWRAGACAQVVVVQGRCPTGAGEAMISARTLAGPYGYALGRPALLPDLAATSGDAAEAGGAAAVDVVGIYRPRDPAAAYWFGVAYFDAAFAYQDGVPDVVDAVLVDRAAFGAFATADGEVDVDHPLDAAAVRLSDQARVADVVRQVLATAPSGARYTDRLPATLARSAGDRAGVATGSLLVSLQLAALALLVLFATTGDALAGRGDDVALAKLRGLSAPATAGFLLAEPVVLLVAAVPLGLLAGTVATHALAGALLVPGVPVVVAPAAVLAAVVAAVGAVLAAAVAARGVLTRPVLEQWRGAQRRVSRGRRALAVDGVVAAAAVAGVVLLATGGTGSAALLAPALLVLAAALLGVRLLPLAARLGVARSADSPRLGAFLAVRQVARRPAGLRLAVLLGVSIGLAVFAVAGESVAAGNRADRARVEIGAPQVVAVQFAPGTDPTAALARADPHGRWAMLAARWLPAGGITVTGAVLGVQPDRLAAVAEPTSHGPSTATIAAGIRPARPPLTVRGTSLTVGLTATDLVGVPPLVDVLLTPEGRPRQSVRLGVLRAGPADYTGAVPCASGCVLDGFGWERPVSSFDDEAATVTVQAVRVGDGDEAAGVDLGTGDPGSWHARSPDGTDAGTSNRVTVGPGGVRAEFRSRGGSSAGLEYASQPDPLPLWASVGAVIRPPDDDAGRPRPPAVVDAGGTLARIRVVGTTAALPGVAPGGVVGDVTSLRGALPGFTAEATWSVWLGAAAPPDATARLAAAGLDPGAVRSTAARTAVLARQGPALALALLLACAAAAAVLATGATVTAIAASGRRRAFELAALRVVGVRRRALVRSTVYEQLAVLGTAVLVGLPTGLLAAVLAMPVVPQFADHAPLPLADTPAAGPVLVLGVAVVVLLVVTAVGAAAVLVRAAVPARLRDAAR